MKKLAAILLLGIFSFNTFGYRLVAIYLEHKANLNIEIALDDSNYAESQLISIKTATNLPYYNNSSTFQRIDGEVEIEGVHYKYVKCRIYNDSLELLCIPNTGKMKIRAATNDFSKMAAEVQQPSSQKKNASDTPSPKKITTEFEALSATTFNQPVGIVVMLHHIITNQSFFNNLYIQAPCQPPDRSVSFS